MELNYKYAESTVQPTALEVTVEPYISARTLRVLHELQNRAIKPLTGLIRKRR